MHLWMLCGCCNQICTLHASCAYLAASDFGGVIDRIEAVPRWKADVIRACGALVPRLAICDHFDHPIIAEFREKSMSGGGYF